MSSIDTGVMITYYNPDLTQSRQQLQAIVAQRGHGQICIVDNSDADRVPAIQSMVADFPMVHYIPLYENKGIGAAQNVGAAWLYPKNDFVIFFDQDSLPPTDMLLNLRKSYEQINALGKFKIGAIGPRAINTQTGEAYRAKLKKGKSSIGDLPVTQLTEIISSGSLIAKSAWETTGGMDEELFIDAVDHEWCWRAAAKGQYSFFIDERVQLVHALGEGDLKILGFTFTGIPKPLRCYYLYRNFLLLLRREYVPTYWKIMNTIKFTIKFVCYPLFLPNGKSYFKYIWKGLGDGIKGKGGKIPGIQ